MSKIFEEIVLEKLQGIDKLNKKVDVLSENVNELKGEVNVLRKDVNELKGEVNVLKEDVSELKDNVDNLNEEVNVLKKSYNSLQEKLDIMSGSIVIIEDKVNKELPLLYEIYSLNYSFQKENEAKINSLDKENFKNSNRISNLEIVTEKHSKQLKKLIS